MGIIVSIREDFIFLILYILINFWYKLLISFLYLFFFCILKIWICFFKLIGFFGVIFKVYLKVLLFWILREYLFICCVICIEIVLCVCLLLLNNLLCSFFVIFIFVGVEYFYLVNFGRFWYFRCNWLCILNDRYIDLVLWVIKCVSLVCINFYIKLN